MRARKTFLIFALLCFAFSVAACFPVTGSVSGSATATARQISFSGPITITLSNGDTFAGTNIKYLGKTSDDRANITIGGLSAPKKTGDSLNWSGAPVPFTLVNLQTRVVTFDDNGITLFGTTNITVQDPKPTPGDASPKYIMEITLPATFHLARNQFIPGTTISYVGKTQDGAQFAGLEGYPYRQQFDSVVWSGHLRDKVFLKADLRVALFSDSSADLAGSLSLRFEQ